MNNIYLGVDIGSISINVVAIDAAGQVLFQSYVRGQGNPVAAVQQALRSLEADLAKQEGDICVAGVCTTGSGRELIGALLGADLVKNEISAHARAAIAACPEVRTVIEIGGQDSKVTLVRDGVVVDFAMNLVCAAGTGSFLDSQARRLGMDIEAFGTLAMESTQPTSIAGRCTVFAESDMIHKQQLGYAQKDIVMGLCLALARNFVGNVCRGKELLGPVLFQGGVSANPAICRAFEEVLGMPILVPEHHMVMGAYGAALLAREARVPQSRFRGFAVGNASVDTVGAICDDCANRCELVEIREAGAMVGRSGGRCGKWS